MLAKVVQVLSAVASTVTFHETYEQRHCFLVAGTVFHQTVFEQMAEDALAVLEYT